MSARIGNACLAVWDPGSRRDHDADHLQARWVFGGSAGSGVVTFHGQVHGLSVGGLDYGLVFGGSQTTLQGKVRNIRRVEDVEGIYGAAGVGVALGKGIRGMVLTNQNGAVLELSGDQIGLMANLDLSGLAIALKK
jgi:hypothetical protein